MIRSSEFSASCGCSCPSILCILFCLIHCYVYFLVIVVHLPGPRSMSSMYCVGLYPQSGDRGLGRTVMGAAEFSELECCMGMRAACLSHILSVIQSSFVSRGRPVSWFSGSLCSLRRWCRYRWWLECVLLAGVPVLGPALPPTS